MNGVDKVLTSSSGSGKLSMTVSGILLSFIPLILSFNISGLDQAYLGTIVDSVIHVLETGIAFISAVMVSLGLIRKAYYFIKDAFGV